VALRGSEAEQVPQQDATIMSLLFSVVQLVIWRTVVEMFISLKPSLLRPWDVTISFLACFSAYLLALPFTSEVRIGQVLFES
jgi:hypothetical protein